MEDTPKIISSATSVPKNAGTAIGASGTYITGGIITHEEYNRKLLGRNGLRIYDIMRRSDSTIRSIMQVVKLPLLAADWSVQAIQIDEDDPDVKSKQEIADYKARFLKRELMERNVDFVDLLRSMLSGLEFGFDVEEKTFELTEFEGQTRVGIRDVSKRKQTTILTWAAGFNGGEALPGVTQLLQNKTVEIPMAKLMVFTHDKEGDNYEGIPMLRYVYKDWDMKDKLTIVNAIAIEKLAVGVPIIEAKPNVTPSPGDLEKAREAVQNMRANQAGYAEIPSSLGLAMLDLKANTTKEVIPTLQYHDRRISQSILAGFLEIGGHSGSGSQSLSKDLTSLFMKSEKALANMLISCLQKQLIKQLCDFNFADMSEGYPTVIASNLADDDTAALGTAVSALVTAGAMTPEATMEDYLRKVMGLPKLPQEIKSDYNNRTLPARAGTPPAPDKPEETVVPKKDNLPADDPEAKAEAAKREARRARRNLIDTLVS